jgi:hypothetical protein
MARREPVRASKQALAGGHNTAADFLTDANLDELLTDAGVPKNKRAACADHIKSRFEHYGRLLSRNEETEARHAEALRLLAESLREAYQRLVSLPPSLRLEVEPDFRSYVGEQATRHVAEATAAAEQARDHPDDPGVERIAFEPASPELERKNAEALLAELFPKGSLVPEISFGQIEFVPASPRPPVVGLPIELILDALIWSVERRQQTYEGQVSGARSKRRQTPARNDLAVNLKGIIMGFSEKMRSDPRAAEKWVAEVFDNCRIRILYPDPVSNRKAFRAMFAVAQDEPVTAVT